MEFLTGLFSNDYLTWKDIIIRVTVAVVIGIIIGVERELSYHPAGIKTHVLVCLGSAVASMISIGMSFQIVDPNMPNASVDISRIAAGVIPGIGFIGGGAIMKAKDSSVVTGITTAATVWISACFGLAIGMGYYKITLISMIAFLFTTITLKWVENKFIKHRGIRFIEICLDDKRTALPTIEDYFDRKQILVTFFDCTSESNADDEDEGKQSNAKYFCRYYLRIPKIIPFNTVMRDLAKIDEVKEVYEIRFSSTVKKQKG